MWQRDEVYEVLEERCSRTYGKLIDTNQYETSPIEWMLEALVLH